MVLARKYGGKSYEKGISERDPNNKEYCHSLQYLDIDLSLFALFGLQRSSYLNGVFFFIIWIIIPEEQVVAIIE